MLIKLESGDYINTEAVEVIKDGEPAYVGLRSNNSIDITPADRDRIVKAMGGKVESSSEVLTDKGGAKYQVMTGRELIASLADDAMQDEPLHESIQGVDYIVPGWTYRAYLYGSSFSGYWEKTEEEDHD
jgi:hypothetical protein